MSPTSTPAMCLKRASGPCPRSTASPSCLTEGLSPILGACFTSYHCHGCSLSLPLLSHRPLLPSMSPWSSPALSGQGPVQPPSWAPGLPSNLQSIPRSQQPQFLVHSTSRTASAPPIDQGGPGPLQPHCLPPVLYSGPQGQCNFMATLFGHSQALHMAPLPGPPNPSRPFCLGPPIPGPDPSAQAPTPTTRGSA